MQSSLSNAATALIVCAALSLFGWCCSSFVRVTAALDTTQAASDVLRWRELHLCVHAAQLLGRLADTPVLRVAPLIALQPAGRALQAHRLGAAAYLPSCEAQRHDWATRKLGTAACQAWCQLILELVELVAALHLGHGECDRRCWTPFCWV